MTVGIFLMASLFLGCGHVTASSASHGWVYVLVAICSVGGVELYRLHVDAIFQHPALVIVGAQTKHVLLVCVHSPVFHPEACLWPCPCTPPEPSCTFAIAARCALV